MKSEVNQNDRISPAEKREAVDLILQSKGFQRAPRLREFLRFVCERTLESGEQPHLREQDIGKAVYQRPEDYNPSEDNIVRVEARNLRRKLEEFFNAEGKDLPIRVQIPRGGYAPVFERLALQEVEADPVPLETEVELTPIIPAVPPDRKNLERMILSLLIMVLAVCCGFLWLRNESLQAGLASAKGGTAEAPFWPMLFDAQHNTYLVLADSGLVAVQDLLKRHLTLSDYCQGKVEMS